MKEVTELHQLKALPLCVAVRTKDGILRERTEGAVWVEIGKTEAPVWAEEDLPAKVIWDYAEEINDPSVEALARLATALLKTQAQQEAQQELAQLFAKHQAEQQQTAEGQSQPRPVAPSGAPVPQSPQQASAPADPQE